MMQSGIYLREKPASFIAVRRDVVSVKVHLYVLMRHLVKRIAFRWKLYFRVTLLAHPRRPSLGYDGTDVTYNVDL
jgi:hypothetical protein